MKRGVFHAFTEQTTREGRLTRRKVRFRAKARQPDIYWSEAGSVLKEKGRERAGKGEGAKGRLSTRLIFSRDPSLYQDHVCHSPLGTILVKIHASHFYIRFLSFLPLTKGRPSDLFCSRNYLSKLFDYISLHSSCCQSYFQVKFNDIDKCIFNFSIFLIDLI